MAKKVIAAHTTAELSAEQHEQDMLEELDRMHEECQTLREDSKAGFDTYNLAYCKPLTWSIFTQQRLCKMLICTDLLASQQTLHQRMSPTNFAP